MFSKNIRIVYLYTVCFITLMMAIGGIISTVNAAARYYLPTVHIPYMFAERFIDERQGVMTDEERTVLIEKEQLRFAEEFRVQSENERIRSIRGIFNSAIVWLIAVPIFAFHWRKISKEVVLEDGAVND